MALKDYFRARRDNKKANALMGLYDNPADPRGILRIDGVDLEHSFWHNFPNIDTFANVLQCSSRQRMMSILQTYGLR